VAHSDSSCRAPEFRGRVSAGGAKASVSVRELCLRNDPHGAVPRLWGVCGAPVPSHWLRVRPDGSFARRPSVEWQQRQSNACGRINRGREGQRLPAAAIERRLRRTADSLLLLLSTHRNTEFHSSARHAHGDVCGRQRCHEQQRRHDKACPLCQGLFHPATPDSAVAQPAPRDARPAFHCLSPRFRTENRVIEAALLRKSGQQAAQAELAAAQVS
jgi:hypothetical protein